MVDIIVAKEHLEAFLSTVRSASNGVLNDSRPRSILSVIGRGFSEGLRSLEERLNAKINDDIDKSVPKLFGFDVNEGVKTQAIFSFTPTQIDNARSFEIATGFRIEMNGFVFQTDSTLSVPPGGLNGLVTATALLPGVASNVVGNSYSINWEPTQGLLSVRLQSITTPGKDPQTIDNISSEIIESLINRSLIKADNYAYVARQVLGDNSAVTVIPNLAKDGINSERGTMHVFASVGGLPLTEDQKRLVLEELSAGWASIYISNITIVKLYVKIFLRSLPGVDQSQLTALINDMLAVRYNANTYNSGQDIDLYDLIGALYKIPGVEQIGSVQFHTGSGVYEAIDIALKPYETVQFTKLDIQFVS